MSEDHPDHWYCIYCEEYHLNSQSCSVADVREVRDARIDKMLADNDE